MRFIPLASSSAGNAYLVEGKAHRILLECGVTFKRLQKLLGFDFSSLSGCFVSHEHKDHSRCWADVLKSGIPVYMTGGTGVALAALEAEMLAVSGASAPGGSKQYSVVSVPGFDVLPFQTFHDAKEPVGFLVRSTEDGETLLFATDTVGLNYTFTAVEIAAVECNYNEGLLSAASRMPEKVKKRITLNHMSMATCCKVLSGLDKSRLREVYLLHLGDATSHETQFHAAASAVCGPDVKVTVAPKEVAARGR